MDKVMASKILSRQLKGIMLHVDLCRTYLLKHNKKCAFTHFVRVLEETKNFMLTNEHLIDKLGAIIEPVQEAKIVIPADADIDKLREIWKTYEQETMKLYEQAVEDEPKCRLWRKLYASTKKEVSM